MKRLGFIFAPLVILLLLSQVVPRFLSGGLSPQNLLFAGAVLAVVLVLTRPRKAATKTPEAVAQEVLDDFSAEAFRQSEALMGKFQAALKDIGSNMPKAAVSKLEKLAGQCSTQEDKYAVAMATALAFRKQNDLKNAIREYNKALVLHPSAKLAYTIGDCNQRLGYLDKARDSYEFASELDPSNPMYFSVIGTTYVGEGDYDTAMDYASEALNRDETYAQALATMSICYGLKEDAVLQRHYQRLAVENGYSESKIEDTIRALKKRK